MVTDAQAAPADVVVVGGGGAGLAAAVEAAVRGGRVVLLEKRERLGGTTALAVGSVTASRTSLQRRAGIVDSTDEHFEDMGRFAGDAVDRDNLDLRRLYVEQSGPSFEWLRAQGLVFFGPMAEPPHRRARMHNVLPGSRAYIHRLAQRARRLGVDIRLRMRAVELIRNDDRIAGVRCEGPGGVVEFAVRRGVILAAGDFSADADLKRRYLGDVEAGVPGINPSSTGDGVRLGLEVGGSVVNGDLALGPELRFAPPSKPRLIQRLPAYRALALAMAAATRVTPPFVLRRIVMAFATTYLAPTTKVFELGAVLVNARGELVTGDAARTLAGEPGGAGWIVVDRTAAARLNRPHHYVSTAPGVAYAYLDDYRASRKDLWQEGDSVPALAASIGVAAHRLGAALSNAIGDGREPRPLRPPFVALGPVRSWIVLTEGGLKIDTSCRVLGDGDEPIKGLLAAGSNGQGGLLLEGHGNHLGWAFVSGRLAARTAMVTGAHDSAEVR